MKQFNFQWRNQHVIKALLFNLAIITAFFTLFSYAAAFTMERFTVEYYDEKMHSANERFSQQFNRVLAEVDELTRDAVGQRQLESENPSERRQALKDLINNSPMIDYGFIIIELPPPNILTNV